ncbi:hypothetical protein EV383_2551 [Pseudonocardia sediminis]|uniref:Uncharacterized protein n=1 Tax=Pseudonocardia sediminis TaxID=1397368 RepID=A0A4Q7UX61_PSEST|nr:DUF6153 family protein [Pseudonocardia sediminis]RZT85674.1 hypothetical protein EV383_2551 [Pseudonocardia sediminis]
MNGRRWGRVLLLTLPVLFGLLGMHALVVVPATGTGGMDHPPVAEATPVPGPHVAATTPVVAAATRGEQSPPAGHGGHDGGMGHLMHLCLAVLAGIAAVLLVAGIILGLVPLPVSTGRARRWARAMSVARPPPVSRRLAQLCVMRN